MQQSKIKPSTTFKEVIQQANQYLSEQKYSDQSIYSYNRIWQKLSDYTVRKEKLQFEPQICIDFLCEEGHVVCISRMTKYECFKYRTIRVLTDIAQSMIPLPKYSPTPVQMPDSFLEVSGQYQAFMLQKAQKERTIETKMSRIRVFFRYLDSRGISKIKGLTFQNILDFMAFLQKTYSPVAKSNMLFTLRDFLRFSEHQGITTNESSRYIDKIYVGIDTRLPSIYSVDETMKILQVINRSSAVGKRDYAIILIAIQLGMRAGDISRLRITDVNWDRNEIQFCQQKTGNYQTLPMTDDICFALADYLKDGRPDTKCEQIFVRMHAPYTAFKSSTSLYRILNAYFRISGVDTTGKHHGMHSMRHSLSARLLEKGTSLPVITGILGHSSTRVTKRYLWMDTELLRKMSLEVPYDK